MMLGEVLKRALRRLAGEGSDAGRAVDEAVGLEARGHAGEARARLHAALRGGVQPDAPMLGLLGRLEAQGGDLHRAQELLERAVRLDPGSADARADLGNVHVMRGEQDAARRSFAAALNVDPRHVPAHNNLGMLLAGSGDRSAALAHFRAAIEADPGFARAIRNLVAWLPDSEVPTGDIAMLKEIVKRFPDHGEANAALGALHLRGMFDATPALAALERAIALGVDDADVHARRGVALQELGRAEDALVAYGRALELDPGHASARFHRSLALLALGRFTEGWRGYETRLLSEDRPRRDVPFPRWEGEALDHRTILIHAEQGVGDEILFASCIPDVIACAGHCVIECDTRLAALYRRSFPGATVIAGSQREPVALPAGAHIDCHVPVGSLPLYLRQAKSDFPSRAGYLRADPAQIAAWRERLAENGAGRRVGISWRGGTLRSRGPARSLGASDLAPLLCTPGVRWVSLQRDADAGELAALGRQCGAQIDAWPDALEDLDATAALIGAVDLTISIDNTVAQIAGGIGARAWVLVPVGVEWRYGTVGEDIAWYPGIRLFRQRHRGEWDSVLDAVCRELRTGRQMGY